VYYLGNGPSLYESVGDLTEFNTVPEVPDKFVSIHLLPIPFAAMVVLSNPLRIRKK
jgi:hypothetical protein